MRPPLVLVLASCLLGCDAASADRLSNFESADGVDVPRIGTVGDYPPREQRLVVNVRADGSIVCEGRTLAFDTLNERLSGLEPVPSGGPNRRSATAVVLRVDGALPWGATSQIVVTCAWQRIDQVFFGVRHETDGVEGAVAACLPTEVGDDGVPRDDGEYRAVERRVAVFARPGPGTAAGVFSELVASRDAKDVCVTLDVDPRVPTRTVLELLDASLRAHADAVEFAIGAPPRRDRALEVFKAAAAARVVDGPGLDVSVSLRDGTERCGDAPRAPKRIELAARSMPPLARLRGRLAGIVHPPKLDAPPVTDTGR